MKIITINLFVRNCVIEKCETKMAFLCCFGSDPLATAGKEVQLTQAIISKNNKRIAKLMSDTTISEWINNHVTPDKLIKHDLDLNVIEWTTAMGEACRTSPLNVIQDLVKAGASLYDINNLGHTAAEQVCYAKNQVLEKMTFLVEYDKALIHAMNKKWLTCLHVAAHEGFVEVCEYALKQGADIDARTVDDKTCLFYAAAADHVDVMKLLVSYGAKINERADHNEQPIHDAAKNGAGKTLTYLLKKGVDVNAPGKDGASPLHYAAENGYVNCIELLMSNGAKINATDDNGCTALHKAAGKGRTNAIDLLICDYGADVNLQDYKGFTALHTAALNGHVDAVKVLKSNADCDIEVVDRTDVSVCELARQEGHEDIVAFLGGGTIPGAVDNVKDNSNKV